MQVPVLLGSAVRVCLLWRRVSFLSVTGQLEDSTVDVFVFLFECGRITVALQSFENANAQQHGATPL